MFSNMMEQTEDGLKELIQELGDASLRVATMCSGTESPLLALRLLNMALFKKHEVKFQVEHVFSCEIEPWKQAYIEANFSPPVIFRDIRDLDKEEATAAFGSPVKVEGNVDILIAGTSCVDNSTLNAQRKDGRDGGGESSQTYWGMRKYIRKHRPRIVIQENTCQAPWDKMVEDYEEDDYAAGWVRLDTKKYYIPHTRQRIYLFAVDKKALRSKSSCETVVARWKDEVERLRFPATALLDDFMFPSDDPRVLAARAKLTTAVDQREARGAGTRDWSACASRHLNERTEHFLGHKRPLTDWSEDGTCCLADFGWNDWMEKQVDRVKDVVDINGLKSAKKNKDAETKTVVWNLSQNVDRQATAKPGITPCLCPSMIPYVTSRGGPLTGIEAMGLQGLPTEDLILTKMSDAQMKDLAGNAMTSTVVGATLCAAMIVAAPALVNARSKNTIKSDSKRGSKSGCKRCARSSSKDTHLKLAVLVFFLS